MPTLLQINVVANWGSTGKIAEDIGAIVQDNGWKSVIAYGRGTPKSQSELIRVGSDLEVYSHALCSRIFDDAGLRSKRGTEQFIKEMIKLKPDIVHLHNLHGYYMNVPMLFAALKSLNVPIVWTLHDCWPFTGHCAHYTYAGCYKWETECNNCPQKRSFPTSYIFDRSTRNFKWKYDTYGKGMGQLTFVAVSDWLAGEARKSFLKDHEIIRIYNGIDTDAFRPSPIERMEAIRSKLKVVDRKVLLGVANDWSAKKGLNDYMSLAQILPKEFVIILVGLEKAQIRQLPSNIIGLTRTTNREELVDLYSLASVVLNLSYEETFGLTTVEGLSCGTSGIVYNSTASPELLSKETGCVVGSGNIKGVKQAIEYICSKEKSVFSEICRLRAKTLFNKEDRYNDYFQLYNKLLNG